MPTSPKGHESSESRRRHNSLLTEHLHMFSEESDVADNVTIHSASLRTVLVYTCCPKVIFNRALTQTP